MGNQGLFLRAPCFKTDKVLFQSQECRFSWRRVFALGGLESHSENHSHGSVFDLKKSSRRAFSFQAMTGDSGPGKSSDLTNQHIGKIIL
jgi:hypothetical protein